MRKEILFFISIISFCLSYAAAQTPTPQETREIKTVSGGVVNSKAANLVKPAYPEAARAVRASGAVNVKVTIDESGTVISAEAVSGHPLLRAASENAARASKFSPTYLEGTPVKVTGIIVYNFVLPISIVQIGYEIAFAEKSPSAPKDFPDALIAGSFSKDWLEERELVNNLGNYFRKKLNLEKIPQTQNQNSTETKTVEKNREAGSQNSNPLGETVSSNTVRSLGTLSSTDESITYKDIDPIEAFKDLNSRLDARYGANERHIWYLKFGRILGSINAEIESREKTQGNIKELSNLIANAPAGIPEFVFDAANQIIKFSSGVELDAEKKAKLTQYVKSIH